LDGPRPRAANIWMCLPSSRIKLQSSQRIHRESECLGPKKKCIPPISNLVLFSLVVCCFELSKKCAWPPEVCFFLKSSLRCFFNGSPRKITAKKPLFFFLFFRRKKEFFPIFK
jgi:hypothetical protein